ncbi:hypothetical protein GLYMA_06G007200v4 [Glycine max]|uniref:Uncharacterized protein n=2 Tax=Glycine subgen. Soja TaxID=1462606 RepID=A0A0R0JF66_SOYBN|nr:hypothetical protein GLYMA_06G007200v4 [Glycine max]
MNPSPFRLCHAATLRSYNRQPGQVTWAHLICSTTLLLCGVCSRASLPRAPTVGSAALLYNGR